MAARIVNVFSALLFLMSVNIYFITCWTYNNYPHYEEKSFSQICGYPEKLKVNPNRPWISNSNQPQNISTGLILRSYIHYFLHKNSWGVECNFTIKAPDGYGLFVTIQDMTIEQSGDDTKGCQNYIRFVKKNQKKHHDLKTKHCGDYTYTNSAPVGIYDSEGEITTEIFIKKPKIFDRFFIVFTVVEKCEQDDAVNNLKKIPESSICMKEEYMCDKIHNCYGHVCEDEGQNCEQNTESPVFPSKHEVSNEYRNNRNTDTRIHIYVIALILFICIGLYQNYSMYSGSSEQPTNRNSTPEVATPPQVGVSLELEDRYYSMYSGSSEQPTNRNSTPEVATPPQVGVSLELEENIVTNLPPSYYTLSLNQESPKEEDPPSYESLYETQLSSNANSLN